MFSFQIPDIPIELKTQMQREQLLAKEAKYQNGVVKAQEYEDLLTAIRDNTNNKVVKGISSWGRRISRTSNQDTQDNHPNNDVWEIT